MVNHSHRATLKSNFGDLSRENLRKGITSYYLNRDGRFFEVADVHPEGLPINIARVEARDNPDKEIESSAESEKKRIKKILPQELQGRVSSFLKPADIQKSKASDAAHCQKGKIMVFRGASEDFNMGCLVQSEIL